MESKKNLKADVSRNGSIYFAVGLALMLFLTYSTINYKTYDKSLIDIGKLDLDADLDEEIPLIDQLTPPPPPPPPPAAPEVIEIVEDEEEIEETVIESTETDQDEEIEVEDIEVEEVYEDVEVPFSVIENVPEYPGCEKGSNSEKRKCMSAKIAKFVQRKFNTDLAGDLGRERSSTRYQYASENEARTSAWESSGRPILPTYNISSPRLRFLKYVKKS
jgi:protein TonB